MSAPARRLAVLQPGAMVECAPLAATLSAAACARRHAAGTPSGRGVGFPVFPRCARCETGRDRLEELRRSGYVPPRFRAFDPARAAGYRNWLHRAYVEGLRAPVLSIDDR